MNHTVPPETESTRIDKYLTTAFPEHSRSYWQKTIDNKLITANNKSITKHTIIEPNDTIEITDAPTISEPQPDMPEVEIIVETDDYIAINKPEGIVSHPNEHNTHRPSIASWAVQHAPQVAQVGDEIDLRPGIVHRLDRDVSGVMIVAKTQEFYEHLKTQFQERTVNKQYIALVHGRDLNQTFDLTFRLMRNKKSGKMSSLPETSENGKEAHTECNILEQYTSSTLLSVHPTTGRTHQIRAHLYAYNYPIIGDTLYNSKKYISKLDERLGRIFLHAHTITFTNLNGEEKTYTSPLPPQLKKFLETLNKQK